MTNNKFNSINRFP